MSRIQFYQVFPLIPEPLAFLEILSRNMWWSWNRDAIELFRRIDLKIWKKSDSNPILFLTLVPQKRFEALAENAGFLAHLEKVKEQYRQRVVESIKAPDLPFGENEVIAYFSMEFGIHESLPLFAGGLGVLAGDHLKAASNMDFPLVGIGLLYREGYFRQYLDHVGWQQEEYPRTDLYQIPVKRALAQDGNDLRISVTGPEGEIRADIWKIQVGRIPLYLLDTNIHENPPAIRDITSRLYAGESRLRLAQEVLLGIGGMRALKALGLFPKVCHMNEGHSAFSSIERLAQTMSANSVDLETAFEIVPRTTVFTTHTPVAAGHDEFGVDMVRPYLEPLQKSLGKSVDEILAWGQPEGTGGDGPFSMFVLGLRMAQYCNGVSELHGKVARRMWNHVWPYRSEDEVPITHVTNGIHVSSFLSMEYAHLFERYLGPDWYKSSRKPENIRRIDDIYDEELWRAHELNRSRLIRFCRQRMKRQSEKCNAPRSVVEAAETVLDPDILTIGFARRFATYKRATLLLQDTERLKAMITSKQFPVQFIFAGKAHPKDDEGKDLIKQLVEFSRTSGLGHRFIFVEDYDMQLARQLVQGADVWLNNPRRPYEACGTSGMKAAVNGVLNVSILDGWWCEGFSDERGWAIGAGEEYEDADYQDAVESRALYNVLENDVIPCFYERRNSEISECWMTRMKASMRMAMSHFCSFRMADDYRSRFYEPAARRMEMLVADGAVEARDLAARAKRLKSLWHTIRIEPPLRERRGAFHVGEVFKVTATVTLGEFSPDEVDVELYYGPLKSVDSLKTSATEAMNPEKDLGGGQYIYSCSLTCRHAGRYGFTARVTPRGDDRIKFTPKLVTWA